MDGFLKSTQMMKKQSINWKLIFFLSIFCGAHSGKSFAQALSLKECVGLAVKNHPDYQSAVLNTELATTNVQLAKSQRLPSMDINFYQSTNTGRSIDRFTNSYINQVYNSTYTQASLRQPIFQWFRLKENIHANQLTMEARKELIDASQNDITILVVQAYLQVLQSQDLKQLAKAQLDASKLQLDRSKLQFQVGTTGNKDLLLLQAQVANDEFSLVNIEGNLQRAKLSLFQLLNIAPDFDMEFEQINSSEISTMNSTVDAEVIYAHLPQVKAADYLIKSFDYQRKSLRAQNLPSLNFFADWNTFFASSNPEQKFFEQINATRNGSFTIGLNVPIFGRLQTNPHLQSLVVQQKIAQNNLRSSKMQINQGYHLASQELENSFNRLKSAESQVAVNTENLHAVNAQLQAGTITASDYILANTNLERANSNLIQSKYAYILQKKIVDFYQAGSWNLE